MNIKFVDFNIHIDFEEKNDFTIYCDEIEIEQVIVNLFNNSIDAIKNNKEKWIKVTLFKENSYVILRFIDSGNGIHEEEKEKIFEPFYTTKKIGEGTGLGLSIVKKILTQYKASIRTYTLEKNTCFEIKFPLAEKK